MEEEKKEKRRPGRPRVHKALVDVQISVTPEQRDWLEGKDASISETIRRLIDRAISRGQ